MKRKIKILHLEDLPYDAELIARELKKGKLDTEILLVNERKKFAKALTDFSPDVILCDHSLHSFDSQEALRIVKKTGVKIPFILVTATMTDEFAANVMKQGADDYIIKDRLKRLPSAIVNSIEKYNLEEQKKAAHERLAFHIENAPLGFIEWDHNGFVKSMSKRAEQIFGWREEEFIKNQESPFSEVYREDLPWVSKMLKQLINGELERNTVQYRNVKKNGEIIWCEWFNSILKDEDGKVATIMSLVQDITEQKNLEQQKRNFFSMASHELKTPVTTIKAYANIAEIMLKESGDHQISGIIKKMGLQVNKLTNLVESLLDITKIENGKLRYNESLFNFDELVSEVIDDMQKISLAHKINCNFGTPVMIFGDKDKLNQVLTNLISNATKYSPKSGHIVVTTKLEKNGIVLSVRDYGIGVPLQDQKKVFEQFYRVNGEKSTYPGMGIGLFICSEIIGSHGGKIWVESTLGKGSTFYIRLPLNQRVTPHMAKESLN